VIVRNRQFAGFADFGALSSEQLRMADDAVASAERGRAIYEVWKPSIDEIKTMRGWLTDPRVGDATFNVFLEKARSAMGDAEWDTFISRWAPQINQARAAYDNATRTPFDNPLAMLGSVGKWAVIGLVAYATIQITGVFRALPRRK
jgi:hypothetical protein